MLGRTISNTSKSVHTFSKHKFILQMYERLIHNSYIHSVGQFCTFNQNESNNNLQQSQDYGVETDEILRDDESCKKCIKDMGKKNFLSTPEKDISTENQIIETDNLLDYEGLEKRFPQPMSLLHNNYSIISNQLNIENPITTKIDVILSQGDIKFKYIINVLWPKDQKFVATGRRKKLAAKKAALKCLYWLDINKKIKNNKFVIYDTKETECLLRKPTKISIKPDISNEMHMLIKSYEKDIKNVITRYTRDTDDVTNEDYVPNQLLLPSDIEMSLTESIQWSQTKLMQRNISLKHNSGRISESSKHLPVSNFREEILRKLEENQVVLINGGTGCGKSTQVPQFIFDKYASEGKATNCNILICQPRRISAISLATRIADERGEELGNVVGYQVRFQKKIPTMPGKMIFCSSGILLRVLQNNPRMMNYSHVIIDEVHERSLDTDFHLLLLKRAIRYNESLKLVVISATMSEDLFSKYFNCPTITVPGLMYPVKMHFLEDIKNLGIISSKVENTDTNTPDVNLEDVVKIIKWISENKEDGAILCFLPGWHEISKVQALLAEELLPEKHIVLPAHSKLSCVEQQKIFAPIKPGVRKIILATDVAETGITINDVAYVVDSAVRKQISWCRVHNNLTSLSPTWVSQANIIQRKGRAGRVKPGYSYHLITKEMYNALDKYPSPEIHNVQLEKAVLNTKVFTREKAKDLFNDLIQPPPKTSIESAVIRLMKLGVLDNEENLTILGRRIALFTFDPVLSKALVYSTIFQCVQSMLSIATIIYDETDIFNNTLVDRTVLRNKKLLYHNTSDHVALSLIYNKWKMYSDKLMDTESFCEELDLKMNSMAVITNQRNSTLTELTNSYMFSPDDTFLNTYENDVGIIGAVLFSVTDQVLRRIDYVYDNGTYIKKPYYRDENNTRITLTTESVNYRSEWPSPFATYISRLYSSTRASILIRESTMIPPLTVILFTQNEILREPYYMDEFSNRITDQKQKYVVLHIRNKLNTMFICDEETADLLLKFRNIIWSVIEYYVENKGINLEAIEEIDDYKNKLLEVLSKMLNEYPRLVDSKVDVAENLE